MAFSLKNLLGEVTQTKTFRLALELALKRVGSEIDEHANNPALVKQIGGSLVNDTSTVVDAVLHGTEVEQIADPPARAAEPPKGKVEKPDVELPPAKFFDPPKKPDPIPPASPPKKPA